jgi:hypothetical protein
MKAGSILKVCPQEVDGQDIIKPCGEITYALY